MSRDRVLPTILTVKQIEAELGIGKGLETEVIHSEFCTYINNHDFNVYLKRSDFDLYPLSDLDKKNSGALTLKIKAKPLSLTDTEFVIQDIEYQKYQVKVFDDAFSESSRRAHKGFTVNKVKSYNGTECLTTSIGSHDVGLKLHIDDLFGKRDEIFYFKHKNLNGEIPTSKLSASNPKNKMKTEDKRIEAFKYWLVGDSGKSIHQDEDLQQCYESKGSPTRDMIWNELHKMNGQLFTSGSDDFKKKIIKKVINLKTGTGDYRS